MLVSRDVSRHITTLSLDDSESSQGPTDGLVAHLGNMFEKMGVEGERHHQVGLMTSRWAVVGGGGGWSWCWWCWWASLMLRMFRRKERHIFVTCWAHWCQYAEAVGVVIVSAALRVLVTVGIVDIGAGGVLHRQ